MANKRIHVKYGDKYGRLTILTELPVSPTNRQRNVMTLCDCGIFFACSLYDVVRGATQSCGCYKKQRVREANLTHGMGGTPEYHAWWDMIRRCNDPTCKAFYRYGERGISVCAEWQSSFEVFFKHMGSKPFKKAELDRVDNNLGYFPGNVRWTTKKINAGNKVNSMYYHVNGVRYDSLSDAAINNGVSKGIIRNWCRANNKWEDCYVILKY